MWVMTIVKIKKCHPDAKMPTKATSGSAGFDLYAAESVSFWPGTVVAISTGLEMEIEPGYEVQIRPRSGLAAKQGVTVINSPGTIDSDFRGVVKVLLCRVAGTDPLRISVGDRIAQMVVNKLPDVELQEVSELSETQRGSGGFGSTGA
jgi:dUTP pyrophosphatase